VCNFCCVCIEQMFQISTLRVASDRKLDLVGTFKKSNLKILSIVQYFQNNRRKQKKNNYEKVEIVMQYQFMTISFLFFIFFGITQKP